MNKIKALRIVAIISGILTLLQFIYPFFLKIILRYIFNPDINIDSLNNASAIGIIGSSDGPTAIFVAHNSNIFDSVLKYGFAIVCGISTIFYYIVKKEN